MKKDVLISIRSCPRYDGDDEPETIELMTAGKFYRKNGIYYIIYQESELTGLEGVTTTLKADPNRVVLIRNGAFASQMIFECGEKHVGLYHVPGAGSMTMSVSAQRIDNTLTDDGGLLKVEYSVEINHTLAGENIFEIEVKETTNPTGTSENGKEAML